MKELPVLMSTEMVRAILDGRKTMTRRVIKPKPENILTRYSLLGDHFWKDDNLNLDEIPWGNYKPCPYGQVGDRLWVRETFALDNRLSSLVWYKASHNCNGACIGVTHKWKPSIFMPRWASRITLEVIGVRVERLQEITEEDAQREGVDWYSIENKIEGIGRCQQAFRKLWDSINAQRGYSWKSNPFCWVISFKKL